MSHEGTYNYNFTRIDPIWCNSAQTGVGAMVIGLNCDFSGLDSHGNEVNVSKYIDGVTGFEPCITFDYLDGNIQDICNNYANECDWFQTLKNQISGSIDSPVHMTGVNFNVTANPAN